MTRAKPSEGHSAGAKAAGAFSKNEDAPLKGPQDKIKREGRHKTGVCKIWAKGS